MVKNQNQTQSGTGGTQVGRDFIQAGGDVVVGRGAPSGGAAAAEPSPRSSARLAGARSFIGVATEEAPVAVALQSWVKEVYQELCPCFVAVKELRLGDRWLEEVEGALESIRLFFVVFSEASFRKHWLHFEAGTAWIRKRPIVVLTHSGLAPSRLPSPYSSFQGCRLDQADDIRRLLGDIASHLGREAPRRLDFGRLAAEMSEAISQCRSAP
jgi:hypothetical protein